VKIAERGFRAVQSHLVALVIALVVVNSTQHPISQYNSNCLRYLLIRPTCLSLIIFLVSLTMTDQVTPDSSPASPKKTSNDTLLLQSIKQIVKVTNAGLASFEEATDESSTMFVSRLLELAKQGRYIATRAATTYERRGQYGPQIVAGSAAVVGGVVALRTGRIPGALAASVTGAAAYGNVYGYEDYSATSWRNSLPNITKKE